MVLKRERSAPFNAPLLFLLTCPFPLVPSIGESVNLNENSSIQDQKGQNKTRLLIQLMVYLCPQKWSWSNLAFVVDSSHQPKHIHDKRLILHWSTFTYATKSFFVFLCLRAKMLENTKQHLQGKQIIFCQTLRKLFSVWSVFESIFMNQSTSNKSIDCSLIWEALLCTS